MTTSTSLPARARTPVRRPLRAATFGLASVLAVLVAPAVVDAAPQVLVAAGDVLQGAGTVSDVTDLAIDDAGHWAASVALDGTTDRHALVVDGVVLVPPATPLPGLPGQVLRGAGSLAVVDGVPIWVATDVTQDPAHGAGAYAGTAPIVVVGQTLAGTGIPFGAVVEAVHQVRAVATGHYLVGLTFTAGGGPTHSLLARFIAQSGGAYDVASVVKTGDAIAGHGATISSLDTGIESLATNALGEPLFVAKLTDGETVVVRGTTEIAGAHALAQPPPQSVAWGFLSGAPVAMNDGGLALIGGASTAWEMLAQKLESAHVIATTNYGPPLLFPYHYTQLFTGQDPLHPHPAALHVTPWEFLIHFAEWDAPPGEPNHGFLRDEVPDIVEGHVLAGGLRATDFLPASLFEIGPVWDCDTWGTQYVARVRLEDGRIAAVQMQPKLALAGLHGCTAYASEVQSPHQILLPPNSFSLYVTNPPSPAARAMLALSTAPASGVSPCGVHLPGIGEIVVSLAPDAWFATVADEGGWIQGLIGFAPIPSDGSLAGLDVYAQGFWIDPTPGAAEPFRLASGARIQVGP